jgi:hypothetical protein
MAKTYQYCVAENWGKGFIDHVESQRITFVAILVMFGKFLHTINMVIFGLLKLQVLLKLRMKHRRLLLQRFKQHKLLGMLRRMRKKLIL